MAKSKRLEDYDEVKWAKRKDFEKKLYEFKDELYNGRDIIDIEPKEFADIQSELKTFYNKENPDRGYYVKYENFIMDVRKPSFGCFVLFVVFAITGFITLIKYIF